MDPEAIGKNPEDADRFRRRLVPFPNARSALKAVLSVACRGTADVVLLPAYVGWSAREGSGVFDPVRELGIGFSFYRIDDRLRIDLGDIEAKVRDDRVRVLLLIHYFGYVDPGYERAVDLARARGVLVVEDEAHAMLTDLVGGRTGRLGEAALFSLHKILPLDRGGTLVLNPHAPGTLRRIAGNDPGVPSPSDYDLAGIAEVRRRNAERITALLPPLAGEVEPLWGSPPPGVVPQTYPVRILNVSRDVLYERMNAAGFGVVSLYHTLVDAIPREEHPSSFALSRTILNLPIHQDIGAESITPMVERLREEIDRLRREPGAVR